MRRSDGRWQTADGGRRTADGGCQRADVSTIALAEVEGRRADGGRQMSDVGPQPELCSRKPRMTLMDADISEPKSGIRKTVPISTGLCGLG